MGLAHSQAGREEPNQITCLLTDCVPHIEDEESGTSEQILYKAEFGALEDSHVNYDTVLWILISLPLILAWGVGIVMLLYLPIRRYIMRKDIRSRMLYVTTHAIVYKVTRPMFLPFLGSTSIERHVILSLVKDVILEQGCLQAIYGLHTIRVENVARGKASINEFQIQGVVDPKTFRKAILAGLSNLGKRTGFQCGYSEHDPISHSDSNSISNCAADVACRSYDAHTSSWRHGIYSPKGTLDESRSFDSGQMLLLRKLDEIQQSIKRIETLIGHPST